MGIVMAIKEDPSVGEIDIDESINRAVEDATREALEYEGSAEAFSVVSDTDYKAAGKDLKAVKGMIKKIEKERSRITSPLLEKKRFIDSLFGRPLGLLAKAELALKEKIGKYLEEIAQAREKEGEERRAAAARLAREAERADGKGKGEVAAVKRAAAAAVISAPLVAEAPDVKGVSLYFGWDFEVVSLEELVKAVARGGAPFCLLQPNDTEIRKRVRALGDGFAVPGIVVHKKSIVRAAKG